MGWATGPEPQGSCNLWQRLLAMQRAGFPAERAGDVDPAQAAAAQGELASRVGTVADPDFTLACLHLQLSG